MLVNWNISQFLEKGLTPMLEAQNISYIESTFVFINPFEYS